MKGIEMIVAVSFDRGNLKMNEFLIASRYLKFKHFERSEKLWKFNKKNSGGQKKVKNSKSGKKLNWYLNGKIVENYFKSLYLLWIQRFFSRFN